MSSAPSFEASPLLINRLEGKYIKIQNLLLYIAKISTIIIILNIVNY